MKVTPHVPPAWYRLLLVIAMVVISWLATTSRHVPVVEHVNDKINHFTAFFTLALLLDFSFPAAGYGMPKALPLFCYGLLIEVVQYFLPHRTFSLFDLGADAAGLFVYWLMVPVLKHAPVLRERWRIKLE